MNWDDLRVAAAVYRAGSYAAAAASLRINETTVARRLARLEQDLGVSLFEAVDGLRQPTARCRELVALTDAMADRAEAIGKLGDTADDEAGLTGRRRIATTDSIAAEVLAPRAPAFLAAHPGLSLDFLASTENVNFSRWEADLAVRLSQPDRGDFLLSKIAELALYLIEPTEPGAVESDLLCAYPQALDGTPELRFLMERGFGPRIRCTTKNLLVIRQMVLSGACGGILPAFLCAGLLDDSTFRATELPERRGVWLLVQPHLKQDAATRTVIDWIRESFAGPI